MVPPPLSQISLPKGYTFIEKIASGAYGHVYLIGREGTDGKAPSKFAVKVIPNFRVESSCFDRWRRVCLKKTAREISMCRYFKECFAFIGYEEMYRSPLDGHLYIIMPYAPLSLFDMAAQPKRLEESVIRSLTAQILCGLHSMHSNSCYHRDLSSRNILVDPAGPFAYICDFGLSRAIPNPTVQLTVEVVTLSYRAPELLLEFDGYDGEKVDVWSVGILLLEMLLGAAPVSRDTAMAQLVGLFSELVPYEHSYWIAKASTKSREFLIKLRDRIEAQSSSKTIDTIAEGDQLSPPGVAVLKAMLAGRPESRKSCEELLQMEWFKEAVCAQRIRDSLENTGMSDGDSDDSNRLEECANDEDEDAVANYLKYIEKVVPLLDESSVEVTSTAKRTGETI